MDLSQFATAAGALPLIVGLVEVFKRALGWDGTATARYAPLLSLVLGVILVGAVTVIIGPQTQPITLPQLVLAGVLNGVLAGLGALGLYDTVGGAVIEKLAPNDTTDVAGP